MKKLLFLLFIGLLFSSCGSSDNGDKDLGFAPINADKFEAKYLNKTFKAVEESKPTYEVTIGYNKKWSLVVGNITASIPYKYTYIGKNIGSIDVAVNNLSCTMNMTFTSDIYIDVKEKCNDDTSSNYIMVFNSSN